MADLATIQLDTDENGLFIELADVTGAAFRVEITSEMVYKLARDLPAYANALARTEILNSRPETIRHHDLEPDVEVHAAAVDVQGIGLHEDMSGEYILMSIDDPQGVRSMWRLKPSLARTIGSDLTRRAENLSAKPGVKPS